MLKVQKLLYSNAHIKAASYLYPDKINSLEWLNEQWSDEEINCCKELEFKNFINDPSLSTFPAQIKQREESYNDDPICELDRYLKETPEIKEVLSVGCGWSEREMWLASRYKNIHFLCIDNAPYIEKIKVIANLMNLSNIEFRRIDLRHLDVKEFDLVYSFTVIYCIPNEALSNYFKKLIQHTKVGGRIFVGCVSNINSLMLIENVLSGVYTFFKGYKNRKEIMGNSKVIGWKRNWKTVKKYLPKRFTLLQVKHFKHNYNSLLMNKLPFLLKNWLMKSNLKTYVLSDSLYLFIGMKTN